MANKKKGPEIRISQTTFLVVLGLLIVGVFAWPGIEGVFKGAVASAEDTETPEPVPPTPPADAPLIEKTKIYLSTIDMADFEGEKQKNLVAGTAKIIKSGNTLETVTTTTTSGAASTAELNGGDVIDILGDASGYYAGIIEDVEISETLQPMEAFIRAEATPTVEVKDQYGTDVTSVTLSTNDVSEVYTLIIKRPGDDSWYQFAGVAAEYNDDELEVQFKGKDGSFDEGLLKLQDVQDRLDTAGYEAWFEYNDDIKNYDEKSYEFFIKTAKDVNPGVQNVTLAIVDREYNLQNGQLVLTTEDSADSDVGLSDITQTIGIV